MANPNEIPAPTKPLMAGCQQEPCSVSLVEFREWLRAKSEGVELAESYYLDSPSHLDAGDTGDSYCWECVQKQKWINRHKKEPWTDIRSEDWRESDSHVFCERCEKPLEHSPTGYHIESEIEHYESNTDPLSATDAMLLLNMIEMGAWEDEKHWPRLEPIAARILSQNAELRDRSGSGTPTHPKPTE